MTKQPEFPPLEFSCIICGERTNGPMACAAHQSEADERVAEWSLGHPFPVTLQHRGWGRRLWEAITMSHAAP